MQYVYLIMFLISGYFVSTRLKISMEHGVFMYACVSFAIFLLMGLLNALSVAYIVLIVISIVAFFLNIIYIIKNKPKLSTILTPGTLIMILVFVSYSIITKNVLMYQWDEATHWGTTVKYMYYSGELWTSGLQTIGLPVFNLIITQIAGYKENLLYLSQWFLAWSCLSLVTADITYKDWKKLLIFSTGSYIGMASFLYAGQLSLYADIVLGIMPISILMSWYLSDKLLKKNIIWISPAMFMLSQIKSGTGMMLGLIVLMIILVIELHKNEEKKDIVLLLIPTLLLLLSNFIAGKINQTALGTQESRTSSLGTMFLSSWITYAAIIITVAAITLFVIGLLMKHRGKNLSKKWWIIAAAIAVGTWVAAAFVVGDMRDGIESISILKTFIISSSGRLAVYFPMCLVVIAILVCTVIQLILKGNRKTNTLLFALIWGSGALYTVGIFLSYILTFSPYEASICSSFDRYMSTILIFLFIALLCTVFMEDEKKHIKKSKVINYLLLAFFAVSIIIYPNVQKTKYLSDYSNHAATTYRAELKGSTKIIDNKVPKDEKVYIVIQHDEGYMYNWLKYELAPRKVNGGDWNFKADSGKDSDWLKDFMHENGYKYLYIHYSDEILEEKFNGLFVDEIKESTLYELVEDGLIICK